MSVISVMMTLTAIVVLCMETMPRFSRQRCDGYTANPFFVGETVCTAWFTVEFLVRLASCPSKRSFFLDFKNAVDLVSVVPYYASVLLEGGDGGSETGQIVTRCGTVHSGGFAAPETSSSLAYLRAIRLIRVVRILKLTKYCLGLKVTILRLRIIFAHRVQPLSMKSMNF